MFLEYKVTNYRYSNINQILKQEFKLSGRLINKVISNHLVLLDDTAVDTRSEVKIGNIIKVDLNYEEENDNIVPVKMNLDILFEDDCLLILNKPAGIAVHPSILHFDDSISNGVRYYFDLIGLKKKIRPVNRLDLNTSGIIVFAKNEYIIGTRFHSIVLAIINGQSVLPMIYNEKTEHMLNDLDEQIETLDIKKIIGNDSLEKMLKFQKIDFSNSKNTASEQFEILDQYLS